MIDLLRERITAALNDLGIEPGNIQLERTKQSQHGDLATNVPLTHAKKAGTTPLKLAEELKSHLALDPKDVPRIEAAPPGFLNFFLADDYLRGHMLTILRDGQEYGKSDIGAGKRAQVEFVSANPTGPLTVGHGRGAILGDTVSNILAWNGYQVEREYYYNDAGRQMRLLGESVKARYREILGLEAEFPEEGYEGDYIRTIAQNLKERDNDTLATEQDAAPFTAAAEEAIFQDINRTLKDLGVVFDSYFNEHSLYQSKALDETIAALEKNGLIFREEGATWLKATQLGRDEDRVLIKSTGEPTYRLPDIAYHVDKIERGFDLMVDIFGADHQATYPDVLAGLQGLGYNTSNVRVLIHQFVTLTQGGEQVKMSTRKATFVTLDELLSDVGRDVARYFFIMRGMGSHLQFDLDLARTSSDENPVYYLQYAHARMVNIGKRAEAFGYQLDPENAPLELLALPEGRTLMLLLWWFPEVVRQVHESLEPQTVANYLQELATAYHRYYTVARVVTDDLELSAARMVITEACRQTLANGLAILGISAPERM
ncbi:MAG: arginine--tRNA ligase [Fidelibacterota bacterium]|nr:MAG: arginine--tRNA ligase [Candidatus Neomarinimicrobiota bacterium]